MHEPDCTEVKRRLALGERDGVGEHLAACAGCRREAARLETVVSLLGCDEPAEIPAGLDREIRRMILEGPVPARPGINPLAAMGLASASLLAVIGGLAAAVAEGGSGAMGPVWVALGSCAYLALCSVLMVPVLARWRPELPLRHRSYEVE
jgi:hypothetical protein